eukprot:11550566-Heterocapsa_arctica.AAC.1
MGSELAQPGQALHTVTHWDQVAHLPPCNSPAGQSLPRPSPMRRSTEECDPASFPPTTSSRSAAER